MDWLTAALRKVEKLPPEHQERRQMCIDDLWVFAQTMNPLYAYGDIHKEVYRWLQNYCLFGHTYGTIERDVDDLLDVLEEQNKLLLLPRAHLKSHIMATTTTWLITRHPEVTILYLSATSELAESQLFAIKGIMESGPYQHFFPEYIHPQDGKREKWNNEKIMIDHPKRKQEGVRDATVAIAGLTTNTTGWHADIIICDDIVAPTNAYTESGRADVEKKVSQFSSIKNTGGFTLAAGTRYHPADIYDSWKEAFQVVYDAEGQELGKKAIWNIKEYAVEKDGVFLWPRGLATNGKYYGFDLNSLARIKGEYLDTVQFFAQYYNDPNDPGSERITRDRFQYIDRQLITYSNGVWRARGKKLNIYAAIDFAYTTNKHSDYTAIVVVGIDSSGYYYILDIDRFKTDKITEMFERIVQLHSNWHFRKLRAECTAAQSMIAEDLKDKIRKEGRTIVIDEFKPSRIQGSKEERIAAVLEPRYENQSIFHIKGGFTAVLEEELILARPKHDDIKDALANAISIAIKPAADRDNETRRKVVYGKFGGIKFRE